MASAQDTEEMLRLATQGFDMIFTMNDLEAAADVLAVEGQENSPFHLMLLGAFTFLKAVLDMKHEFMEDAVKCLTLAKQVARKHMRLAKSSPSTHRFQSGIEWEVIHADASFFLGLIRTVSKQADRCTYLLHIANHTRDTSSVCMSLIAHTQNSISCSKHCTPTG